MSTQSTYGCIFLSQRSGGGGADAAAEEGGSARGRELRTKGREAEAQALLAPPLPPSLSY